MYVVTVREHKKISSKYRKPNTLLDDLNKDRQLDILTHFIKIWILRKTRYSRLRQFRFFAGIREELGVFKGSWSQDKYIFLKVYKFESWLTSTCAAVFF